MIGDIISELRKDQGLTQDDLAIKLNVARSTVASWEVNVNEPGAASIVEIADLFNVSCDYLLGRTKERNNLHLESNDSKEFILNLFNFLKAYKIVKK
ncbi:MAG: helix-turn-helix transcriptional regulator [Clostridium sp.]